MDKAQFALLESRVSEYAHALEKEGYVNVGPGEVCVTATHG